MIAYGRALETEIRLMGERYGHARVDTVFLGGGTPSVMPVPAMRAILRTLRETFTLLPDAEFTSEANPGTLTHPWLDTLTAAGMNRLSLGVQAAQDRLLREIGRIHTLREAREALTMARAHGLSNLNADAMFGLPGQACEDYLETLNVLVGEGITHLSAYALILEEGTPLFGRVAAGSARLPDEDAVADMMEAGVRLLADRGYARYEISNFARPGFACRHNQGYWRQKPYLGLGLSAASLLPAPPDEPDVRYLRRANTTCLETYLLAGAEGRLPPAAEERIGPEEAMFETVLLGLRTVEGLRYKDFERMHGQRITDVYGDAILRLTEEGLLLPPADAEPVLALTERGMSLQNTALMAFMR